MQRKQGLALEQYKELVAKISQDAKERMAVRKVLPSVQGREVKTETGKAAEVLAEIAGTGIVQLNFELISAYPPKLTYYNILLYIYLYLKVINISKTRKFTREYCRFEGL